MAAADGAGSSQTGAAGTCDTDAVDTLLEEAWDNLVLEMQEQVRLESVLGVAYGGHLVERRQAQSYQTPLGAAVRTPRYLATSSGLDGNSCWRQDYTQSKA